MGVPRGEKITARKDGAKAEKRPANLRYLPLGVWVRMDKYNAAPFGDKLPERDGTIDASDAARLVFIEPQMSSTFGFRRHKMRLF